MATSRARRAGMVLLLVGAAMVGMGALAALLGLGMAVFGDFAWGWLMAVFGALGGLLWGAPLLILGIGVRRRSQVARWLAVVVLGVSIVASVWGLLTGPEGWAFLPPLASVAIAAYIIWALLSSGAYFSRAAPTSGAHAA